MAVIPGEYVKGLSCIEENRKRDVRELGRERKENQERKKAGK